MKDDNVFTGEVNRGNKLFEAATLLKSDLTLVKAGLDHKIRERSLARMDDITAFYADLSTAY